MWLLLGLLWRPPRRHLKIHTQDQQRHQHKQRPGTTPVPSAAARRTFRACAAGLPCCIFATATAFRAGWYVPVFAASLFSTQLHTLRPCACRGFSGWRRFPGTLLTSAAAAGPATRKPHDAVCFVCVCVRVCVWVCVCCACVCVRVCVRACCVCACACSSVLCGPLPARPALASRSMRLFVGGTRICCCCSGRVVLM